MKKKVDVQYLNIILINNNMNKERKSHRVKGNIDTSILDTKYVQNVRSLSEAMDKLHYILLVLKSRYNVLYLTMKPKKYSDFLLMTELYRTISKFIKNNYHLHKSLDKELKIDLEKIEVIRKSLKGREERRVLSEEVKELLRMIQELLFHLENYVTFNE